MIRELEDLSSKRDHDLVFDLQEDVALEDHHSQQAAYVLNTPHQLRGNKRRKSVETRVVNVRDGDVPPEDTWAWRKYGQKPIKGSPFPRSYYRCSSSKGCSARKQVERSKSNPSMLVVTYTSDHNHPPILNSNKKHHGHHHHHQGIHLRHRKIGDAAPPPQKATETEIEAEAEIMEPENTPSPSEAQAAADVEAEGTIPLTEMDNHGTQATSSSPSHIHMDMNHYNQHNHGDLLPLDSASIMGSLVFPDDEDYGYISRSQGLGDVDIDDDLFADLGELPEWSAFFLRNKEAAAIVNGIDDDESRQESSTSTITSSRMHQSCANSSSSSIHLPLEHCQVPLMDLPTKYN